MFDRPHGAHRALGEFEHQRRRDGAIGFHEFEKFRKSGIGEGRPGHVAEQTDIAVLQKKPPHHLDAARAPKDDRASALTRRLRHRAGNRRRRRVRRRRREGAIMPRNSAPCAAAASQRAAGERSILLASMAFAIAAMMPSRSSPAKAAILGSAGAAGITGGAAAGAAGAAIAGAAMAESGVAVAATLFAADGGLDRGHRGRLTLVASAASCAATKFGQLLDQRGQFLDFGGERLGSGQGAIDHGIDLALHRAQPAARGTRQIAGQDRRSRAPDWRAGCLLPASCLRAAMALSTSRAVSTPTQRARIGPR